GVLADRWGGRNLMAVLMLLAALPSYLLSTVHSYTAALLCALAFGVAGNTFSVGIAWNAAWCSRERQGFALGTFGAGNVGASLTKLFGPALIALVPASGLFGGAIAGGWRFVPALYAALLVVMSACLMALAPSPDRKPGANRALSEMMLPLKELRVWRFGLYYVVVFGAYVAFSLWLPNYYHTVYGLPLARAAMLTALFIFPASLLRPLGGYLSDKLGPRPVTYAVFAAMLLACIPLLTRGTSLSAFVACIEVLGIGMGVGKASVYKYIPEYYPSDVGLVGGLVGTLGALGGFFLPLGFGYLEAATGRPESCFWVMLALILWSFGWLHRVVLGMRRESVASMRPQTASLD
ncbi:MAG TPA: MFS transporter, partial [Polyangiales bacterium]|nr:MFS transporter [Polyangiales bacterium]